MFLILWKELIFLNVCRCTCRWSFIFQYQSDIQNCHTLMWSVATSKCLCLAREVKELVHWVFSSPSKDNFMLMKNAAEESDVQRSPRSTRGGAVLWCPVCNGNGALWPLRRLGRPSLCWTKGLWPWLAVCGTVTTLTSSWCRGARRHEAMSLAHIRYLSCTPRHYWNSSHDQQAQRRCSLPISFQGEGRALLTAWPTAQGLLRLQPSTVKTGTAPGNLGRRPLSRWSLPKVADLDRVGILPAGSAQALKWFSFPMALPKTFNSIF